MARIEKTVFISYRRTNLPWALAIYQHLTAHGYDVFFDYQSIDSGSFEKVILENIRARAHFLVLLAPSSLERCSDPNDWLRREIETAIDEKRNIVPIFLEGFDFTNQYVSENLTGKLEKLKLYNGLTIPLAYVYEAMEKLRTRYLNISLDILVHPLDKPLEQPPVTEVPKSKPISRPLKVFLCHASQDKPVVRELYNLLVANSVDAWLDEEKILPGQEWDFEIESAVKTSDAVIIFLSIASVSKEGYIQKELRTVIEIAREKPKGTIFIIPIRLDECAVPEQLQTWQYVDFFPNERKEWAYQRLKSSLDQRAESLKL